jgi:hypothetical protein
VPTEMSLKRGDELITIGDRRIDVA